MNGLALPAGTRWAFAGHGEEQAELVPPAWRSGLGLSIVLMYMVLTILYESWLQPVLILHGAAAGDGRRVPGPAGLPPDAERAGASSGIIALFGLVGKNAILLVDRANDLRRARAGPDDGAGAGRAVTACARS